MSGPPFEVVAVRKSDALDLWMEEGAERYVVAYETPDGSGCRIVAADSRDEAASKLRLVKSSATPVWVYTDAEWKLEIAQGRRPWEARSAADA